jgi:hypothetical protein
MYFSRSRIPRRLFTAHQGHKILGCTLEFLFDLAAVGTFSTSEIDHQMLTIVVDIIGIVYTFLNTLTPLAVFIPVSPIIVLKLVLVATVVFAHAVPTLVLVSTDSDQKESRIDFPDLLHFGKIAEPINDDTLLSNLCFIYSFNDLVDPIPYAFPATRVSMLLKHLPPTLLPFGDHLAHLFDLTSNIIRHFERAEAERRLGEDIPHGAAAASEGSCQPDYQVGAIARDTCLSL